MFMQSMIWVVTMIVWRRPSGPLKDQVVSKLHTITTQQTILHKEHKGYYEPYYQLTITQLLFILNLNKHTVFHVIL
jgi:hypothetical protein